MVIEEVMESVGAPEGVDHDEQSRRLAEEAAEFICRQVLERGATFNDG